MDFRSLVLPAAGAAAVPADALLVVMTADCKAAALGKPVAKALQRCERRGDLVRKAGKSAYLSDVPEVKAGRVVFAVAGGTGGAALRDALAQGLGAIKGLGVRHLAVRLAAPLATDAGAANVLATATGDATYLYRLTKPSAPAAPALERVTLLCDKAEHDDVAAGLKRGAAVVQGVTLARELANRPANHCTPSVLADTAKALGKSHGLKVEVLDRKDVEKLGMGAFLAVAQASAEPLKFIVARYQGAGKADAPVVLVGKGITFDTGGISIKPAAEMDEMKFDMGGAASVLGTLRAVAELKPKVNLVGIIPACENMPGGKAVKPGDVVTSMSGQTIEILNTDAEGRLILCDALCYAERFQPAVVVDIATLTGACVIALGHHRSGLFSPDDALAAQLQQAGDAALDPCWRMPLDEVYDEALKSNFADMGNVGGRAGGSITAAMFLKRFVGTMRWAHLDIAGTAWKSGAAKGATGRPVGLLTHFVLARAA
jgi:leucyl aminopeptidase